MSRYLVYDVFTDRPFAGNQLAVFPNAWGLDEALLQPVTREFGFSETIFLYPQDDGSVSTRIFTPGQEVPFAGHPLIGALVSLHDEEKMESGEITLNTEAGPVPGRIRDGTATFARTCDLEYLGEPDPALVADCLGLAAHDVRTSVIASAGLPFALTELSGRAALSKCTPVTAEFRKAEAQFDLPFDFAVYAWVREGETIHARMFAPLDGIEEDPATGSAATALGMHLAGGGEISLRIHQGEDMGRPSHIGVKVRGTTAWISGRAVRVMEGNLVVSGAGRGRQK